MSGENTLLTEFCEWKWPPKVSFRWENFVAMRVNYFNAAISSPHEMEDIWYFSVSYQVL